MKSHLVRCLPLAAFLLGFLVSCSEPREISQGVQLVLNTEALSPTTTFELRFDDAVARAVDVGRPAEPSPLIIQPPLAGRFTWLSQRSGVFTPSEPTKLGAAYRFALRRDLKTAAGQPLAARLERTLQTPALQLEGRADEFGPTSISSEPEVRLQFNAGVRPVQIQPYLQFRNRAGLSIAARVLPAAVTDPGFPGYFAQDRTSALTWEQQFLAATAGTNAPPISQTNAATPHCLLVSPVKPLPFGEGWKLVVTRGLPAAQPGLRLPATLEIKLGNVVAFILKEIRSHNGPRDGKTIGIVFSKRIAPELSRSNALDWIAVTPAPTNLSVVTLWNALELRGDFRLDQTYSVRVRPGVPAADGSSLAQAAASDLLFTPLPPRLYWPAFAADQLGTGRRELELLAVNTGPVRVRARQLDRHALIHVLRGYRGYFKSWEDRRDSWREPFHELDFNLVAGRTIYDQQFDNTNRIDQLEPIRLKWDDVLGRGQFGAVFLDAEQVHGGKLERARQGSQTVVQLTDLGLAWKTGGDAVTVFVFSHATARPVTNATVHVLTDENETLAEQTTDGQGLARLPLSTNAVWFMAEAGSDLHAVRRDEHQIQLYGFNVPIAWREEADDRQALIFTDRPVYRPGETVHLKAIVRDWRATGFTIPAGLRATLRVTDPKEDRFFETNLVLSALGSLAQSIPLPQGVRGHYQVALALDGREFTQHFQVADFQVNAFSVRLDAHPDYAAGEPVRVPLSAQYYMGAPLTRAKVRWSLEASDAGFSPPGFEPFQFTTGWQDQRLGRNPARFSTDGEGAYSTNFIIAPEIPFNPAAPQPRSIHLRAEITDLNQQTIARATDFVRHSSEFYLGLKMPAEILRARDPLPLELIAVKTDGQPMREPVAVTLTLQRLDYQTLRLQGAGRAVSYRSELHLTNVLVRQVETCPMQKTGNDWQVSRPLTGLVAGEPGQYLLEARAKDAGGREVVTVASFYVAGPGEHAWAYRNEVQIDLAADQKSYVPGQVATLLVKTPISGTALVTVERDTVLRSFLAELSGNTPAIHVPIEEADAPNVFVSVLLVRGAADSPRKIKTPDYRLGYCQLQVENPKTKLRVSVNSDATEYRPTQTVNATATVTDPAGQPVPNAEVTLYAVDEGILSLTDADTPEPHAFFFKQRPLAVQCGVTLPRLFNEDPEQLSFQNKGYLIGGGGRERLRKDFLPCAYWNAALTTDNDGKVSAGFVAPDSLTRYRIMAVAHTAQSQFGSGQSGFEINKPLMIEPALPQFANVTDRILARAVVHNRTAEPGQVEVILALDDKAASPTGKPGAPAGALTNRFTLGALTSAAVEFPLEFSAPGTAQWIWRARFIDPLARADQPGRAAPASPSAPRFTFTDAVQSTLQVGHIAPLLREVHLAHTDEAETNLLRGVNPQLLEGEGTVTVFVSNTRLSELSEAVNHLLHYPYGCVEQTSSSLLPWLVLRNAPSIAPQVRKSPGEIQAAIRAGVQRLCSMQTASGGLSYWPGANDPMVWGSAYGGMVLALARRGEAPVPQASLDRLLKYLSESLRAPGSGQSGQSGSGTFERCLALYTLALAGKPEPAYHELLFKQRAESSEETRALLALAILESDGPAQMVDELLVSRPTKPRRSDDWFGCDTRPLAIRLLAWSRHRPADGAVDVQVAELMNVRALAHWGTTQGNAWALFALTEYAARVESQFKQAEGTLSWGSQVAPFRLGDNATVFQTTFATTRDRALLPLALANPAKRRLFTQLKVESRAPAVLQPRQDRGFSIQRTYARLDDDGVAQSLDKLRVGDRVLVSLSLRVREAARYVAVDDPLPALFEAVHPEFKSQETAAPVGAAGTALDWFSDFRELRADRALFFRDYLEPGEYTIRYLARVRAAGTATAPATKVEEMYHPERFGLSETLPITSRPLE